MTVLSELKEIITKHINVNEEDITLDADLSKDLDADSIEIAEVVMDIEEKYGFEFTDEAATSIEKIKDLVDYIEENK